MGKPGDDLAHRSRDDQRSCCSSPRSCCASCRSRPRLPVEPPYGGESDPALRREYAVHLVVRLELCTRRARPLERAGLSGGLRLQTPPTRGRSSRWWVTATSRRCACRSPRAVTGRLQARSAIRGRAYAFAQSGSPLSQYRRLCPARLRAYRPQRLVVNVVGNDFDESVSRSSTSQRHFSPLSRSPMVGFDFRLTPLPAPGSSSGSRGTVRWRSISMRNVGITSLLAGSGTTWRTRRPLMSATPMPTPVRRASLRGNRVIDWFLARAAAGGVPRAARHRARGRCAASAPLRSRATWLPRRRAISCCMRKPLHRAGQRAAASGSSTCSRFSPPPTRPTAAVRVSERWPLERARP